MDLIKHIIESDTPVLINKEFLADIFPLCIEWFAGNDLILEPADFQKIKITDKVNILRKGNSKKGNTDLVPFLFLESVRRGDCDRARKYLGFHISDANLKNYFGEFEILVNNYLNSPDVFSILPKNTAAAKNFVFQIIDGKIANITDA